MEDALKTNSEKESYDKMFLEVLEIMSESSSINQYQLIDKLMSTDLFHSFMTNLKPKNGTVVGYLKNIVNMVTYGSLQSANQNPDLDIQWCINKFSSLEDEDILSHFLVLKPKLDGTEDGRRPQQFEFQHPCSMKSDKSQLCYVLTPKKYPNCQHFEYLPCHIDINRLKCNTPVQLKLKCGHELSVPCCKLSKEQPKCQVQIAHKFQNCGHMTKIPCSTDTSKLTCSYKCRYRLECGHSCPYTCHQHTSDHTAVICSKPCEKVICERGHRCPLLCYEKCPDCTKMVKKERPCGHTCLYPCSKEMMFTCTDIVVKQLECGHTIKTLCCCTSIPNLICTEKCEKILTCGHQCQTNCNNPCTTRCIESKKVKRTCGHEAIGLCYMSSVSDPDNCTEPCNAILPCLHKCKGTCGQCRQGRLHVPCQTVCNKPLICGHLCEYICSPICPPCSKLCLTECKHSECQSGCRLPCTKCIEKCEWKCKHFRCRKLCHELCDRPRCNESCNKYLVCGHRCVGLCGEQCPDLCRVCDYKKLTEFILSGKEDEEDAKFIQLNDCRHCIEVNGLDNWMDTQTEEIKRKECPRCKTIIWNSNRYGNIIKKISLDIEYVKRTNYGNSKELEELSNKLLRKLERNTEVTTIIDSYILELISIPHHNRMAVIENQMNILESIGKLKLKFDNLLSAAAKNFFAKQADSLVRRLMQEVEVVNEGTMTDIYKELTRIKFQSMTKHVVCLSPSNIQSYRAAKKILSTNVKLTVEEEEKVEKYLHEIFRYVPHYGLGISNEEREMIVTAVGLKPGHWYKCPNGHIYVITECGGAQERGKCNECGAQIGGENHRLDSSNSHASEMDGSAHSAWSNQTGLG